MRGVIRHKAEEELIQLGATQPVVIVCDKAGKTAGLPFIEDKWTAADCWRFVPFGGIERAQASKLGLQNVLGNDRITARTQQTIETAREHMDL